MPEKAAQRGQDRLHRPLVQRNKARHVFRRIAGPNAGAFHDAPICLPEEEALNPLPTGADRLIRETAAAAFSVERVEGPLEAVGQCRALQPPRHSCANRPELLELEQDARSAQVLPGIGVFRVAPCKEVVHHEAELLVNEALRCRLAEEALAPLLREAYEFIEAPPVSCQGHFRIPAPPELV